MQEGLLVESNDYSSKKLREQLKRMSLSCFVSSVIADHGAVCATKADQVFLPVLENASKAQKLRSTLAVFERSDHTDIFIIKLEFVNLARPR